MKRLWIVLTLFFMLALIIGATGCISPTTSPTSVEREFRLAEWRMIDDNGQPALQIAFTLSESEAEIPKWAILARLRAWSVRLFPENGRIETFLLTLIDPDGIEVASRDVISSGVTGAKLNLFGNMPKAGQYRLIVREHKLNGEIIATETLSFEGAEATISDVKLTWGSLTRGYVYLKDIRYNIRNDGDIPVYFNKVKLVIGDNESSSPFMYPNGVVLPEAEKTFHTTPFGKTEIKPGEYAANLELRDRTDEVICSYSFVVAPAMTQETEFELTQWKVVDHVGRPALLLRFTLYGDIAFLYLTNPDGFQTDSGFVIVGMNEITIDIAGGGEMPDSGQYALIVKDDFGNIIAKEEFYFKGAEATISDVELTWDYMENFEFYSLKRISFIVSNNGDLPADIFEARIAIGDKVISPIILFKVLPGETKTIERSLIFTGITSGDKEFTLELKDITGKVVGSYSFVVAPGMTQETEFELTPENVTDIVDLPSMTQETEFELTQWEVVDHVGPALLIRFTLYGNIADLYLTNPDGVQTDSKHVIVGMNEITLNIAGFYETPDAGQYTLIAKDDFGNIIAKEEFHFEGAEATISDVELTWEYDEIFKFYSLKRISFIVSNNGDLSADIFESRIAIGDKVSPISPIKPFKVLPGEKKTIEKSLIFTGITSGDKEFTLELKDITGKVVGSYSRNVTPTE